MKGSNLQRYRFPRKWEKAGKISPCERIFSRIIISSFAAPFRLLVYLHIKIAGRESAWNLISFRSLVDFGPLDMRLGIQPRPPTLFRPPLRVSIKIDLEESRSADAAYVATRRDNGRLIDIAVVT